MDRERQRVWPPSGPGEAGEGGQCPAAPDRRPRAPGMDPEGCGAGGPGEREERRLAALWTWEKRVGSPAVRVAGVDEAGRGPLAGPVAAAAVILDPAVVLPGLNDSKQLSPAKRARLAELIKEKAIAWAVGWASVDEIDRWNIRQASLVAMQRAVAALAIPPDFILVDGKDKIPNLGVPQEAIVGGDRVSASIAAASILAKVARDACMEELHRLYPCYGFNRHKGYPTKAHYQALAQYGPSPVHRKSFGRERKNDYR